MAWTGNIYAGLYYPIGVALMTVVIGFFFLGETKDTDIAESSGVRGAGQGLKGLQETRGGGGSRPLFARCRRHVWTCR